MQAKCDKHQFADAVGLFGRVHLLAGGVHVHLCKACVWPGSEYPRDESATTFLAARGYTPDDNAEPLKSVWHTAEGRARFRTVAPRRVQTTTPATAG